MERLRAHGHTVGTRDRVVGFERSGEVATGSLSNVVGNPVGDFLVVLEHG